MLWDEQGWVEPNPKYVEFSKRVELN
jgi:hypothetical protein